MKSDSRFLPTSFAIVVLPFVGSGGKALATQEPTSTPEITQAPAEPSESTPPPEATAAPESACLDFVVQSDAQAFFSSEGGPDNDPHGLDADRDGVGCESLRDRVQTADGSSGEALGELPPSPEPSIVPVIPRTGPRSMATLVERLELLTEYGLPLQQVLIEGMGRFPVAGRAHYYDD